MSIKISPLRRLGAKIAVNRITLFAARQFLLNTVSDRDLNIFGRFIKNNFMPSYVLGGLRSYAEEKVSLSDAINRHNENIARNIEYGEQSKKAYDLLVDGKIKEFNKEFGKITHLLDFSGVKLEEANLREANLIGVNFRGAILDKVDLSRANLERADFRGADLIGANFRGAILKEAKLQRVDLFQAKLIGAKLYDADLQGAILNFANLSEANLRGAILKRVYTLGANFSRADLTEAKFEKATIDKSTYFNGAIVTNATGIPSSIIEKFGLKV